MVIYVSNIRCSNIFVEELLKHKSFYSRNLLYNQGQIIDIIIPNAKHINSIKLKSNARQTSAIFILLSHLIQKNKMSYDEIQILQQVLKKHNDEMTKIVYNLQMIGDLNENQMKHINCLISYFDK